jgi:NADH:ubiquinone oxidoreductase subunit D
MKIVELYEGTLFECQMIKNLLENEGIESQLTDEIIGSRAGAAWRTAGGVRIIVSDEFYDKARMVVNEFEKSRKGNR